MNSSDFSSMFAKEGGRVGGGRRPGRSLGEAPSAGGPPERSVGEGRAERAMCAPTYARCPRALTPSP